MTTSNATAQDTKPAKNFREFERENEDVKKGEHIKVPLNRITIKKGFNPRDLSKPETQAKITLLQAAYEAGDFVPLPIVRMALDGESAEIVDGECRYTAACLANAAMTARGETGIEWFEAIRFSGTEAEARSLSFKANQGEHLTPLEQADHTIWYREQGYTREDIATFLGKSIGWIDRLIVISKLPAKIKKLVADDRIAAEEAVKYVKKHGDKAYEEIMASLDKSKGKVTPKHAAEPTGDDDGDAGDDGAAAELAAAEKKAEKTAEKAEQKRLLKQLETAKELAFALPDKIKKPRNLADDQVYPLELTGAAIKHLIALQDKFTPEIEAALRGEA